MNEFYTHGAFPVSNSQIQSGPMRAELDAVQAGFDKLPTITGNTGKKVVVGGGSLVVEDDTAANVEVTPVGGIAATNVQSALAELDSEKAAVSHNHDASYSALGHTHAASDVSFAPAGTIAASTVQAAIAELGSETQTALSGKSSTGHNHAGVYEPADATILKSAAIGSTVQGYDVDTAFIDQSQTWTGAPKTSVQADNDLSFDISVKKDFTCTPTAGGTLTFAGIAAGQKGEILLVNNSNYAISKIAAVKCSSSMLTTISATGTYLLAYRCFDGTNVHVTNSGALA